MDDWDDMIDVNIKGVLYGIAAALPVFRAQGFGHFVTVGSTAGHVTRPTMAVYSATKYAVRAISETLRQEAGDKLRVTLISPGLIHTEFAESMTSPDVKRKSSPHATRSRSGRKPSPTPSPTRLGSRRRWMWGRLWCGLRRRDNEASTDRLGPPDIHY